MRPYEKQEEGWTPVVYARLIPDVTAIRNVFPPSVTSLPSSLT